MPSTAKPIRKAIKKAQKEAKHEIMSAPEKRIPDAKKRGAAKFYSKLAKKEIKHAEGQGYISRKGKRLMQPGDKVNATLKGGYDRNLGRKANHKKKK